MADYDWGPACGCGFMQPHRRLCKDNPQYENNVAWDAKLARMRSQGFIWSDKVEAWQCRRGCGTYVWNVADHTVNVCRNFNPVVGESNG